MRLPAPSAAVLPSGSACEGLRSPTRHPFMKQAARAFTLIELLTVLAIIAILAPMAVPSMQDGLVRQQIVDAMKLADVAKAPVAAMWTAPGKLPADNTAAGLPLPDK